MKWLSNFLANNKKLLATFAAAVLVSVGVPYYIATPLSNEAVEKIADEVAEEIAKDEKEEEKEARLAAEAKALAEAEKEAREVAP